MEQPQKTRLRAAAYRALRVLPPAVGALVSRELFTWEEFGYRLGQDSLVWRAVDELLKEPLYREPRNEAGKSAVGYGD